MAKPKSFIQNISIDYAKKSHCCRHSKSHRINAGDLRLSVKEGRSYKRYCRDCAINFLERDMERFAKLLDKLRTKNAAS